MCWKKHDDTFSCLSTVHEGDGHSWPNTTHAGIALWVCCWSSQMSVVCVCQCACSVSTRTWIGWAARWGSSCCRWCCWALWFNTATVCQHCTLYLSLLSLVFTRNIMELRATQHTVQRHPCDSITFTNNRTYCSRSSSLTAAAAALSAKSLWQNS